MKRVVVIGGGLGGLSAAIRLAYAGCSVTVLEQQAEIGGKLQRVQAGEYRFDRGPSTITMPDVFEAVFTAVGRKMEDYLTFYRLEPGARNRFADGRTVDLSSDPAFMEEQIAAYCPEDAAQYRTFMKESAALYDYADKLFMNRLLLSWKDKADLRLLAGLVRVRPWLKLDTLLRRYFRHPHTLALFGRYATYVGSDPKRTPAIFGMLPHVETAIGIYGVRGGTCRIAEAFRRLAEELGVTVETSVRAERILSHNGAVSGVDTAKGVYSAELVIANGDVLSVSRDLLAVKDRPAMPDRKIDAYEPSLSGFVILAGIRRRYDQLLHHTVFFPERYGSEFHDIFDRQTAAADPALYICHSGFSEEGMAPPGGSNLFILANAPYTKPEWDWEERKHAYSRNLLDKLAGYGLQDIAREPEVLLTYTPSQLQHDTSAFRGAIYGISSNSARQTFARPSNKGQLEGLWFVGGTTHPGGGTTMVTLSGQLVAEAIIRQSRLRA